MKPVRSTSEPTFGRPGIAADVATSMTAPVPPARVAAATTAWLRASPTFTSWSSMVLGSR